MIGGYDDQGNPNAYAPYAHGNQQHVDPEKVNDYTLADYGLTADTVKAYMYAVKVLDPETGKEMGEAFYNHVLEVAIGKAEKELDIAILPRFEEEHHDYHQSDFNSFMYTHTFKRPILQVEALSLEMNGRAMYRYPSNWWKVYNLAGHIELYPTALMQSGGTGGMGYDQVFSGYPQLAGMPPAGGANYAPQMIHVNYIAGLVPRERAGVSRDWEMPADLEQLIIKYALKEVFQVWGRLIVGAGIASKTLIIDGVSESIETTQSAMYTGSAADIILIDDDIAKLTANLKSFYGFNLGII